MPQTQSRDSVEARLLQLYPSTAAILALADEQRLPRRSLPEGAPADVLIDALFELAERHGRLKGLLRSCLRSHPDDPVLRDALQRDARFAGETGVGSSNPAIGAASSLRGALAAWKPTHVWSLDDAGKRLAVLLAGGLGDCPLIDPPASDTQALAALKGLAGTEANPSRVVLIASDETHLELGRALVERSQSMPIQLRLVHTEGL